MKCSTPWIWLRFSWLMVILTSAAGALPDASPTNRFHFRFPLPATFRVDQDATPQKSVTDKDAWLRAWPDNGSSNFVEFSNRVVVQLKSPDLLKRLLDGRPLVLSRKVSSDIFILQAPDAFTALREAQRFADMTEVMASYPVMRRKAGLHGPYALRSNDPFFVPYFNLNPSYDALWYLENRNYDGSRLGVDLDVLAAWPFGKGQGVTVAVADTGLEMAHPELAPRLVGAPHFNFDTQTTNAGPFGGAYPGSSLDIWTHGTSVAGLIAAEGNNARGMVGVAPQAKLASWVIYTTNLTLIPDEQLMQMYEFASNTVAIQNHSWGGGNGTVAQVGPTLLEKVGIGNAITLGRHGLGTIMVRSAGNDRNLEARADDDGYPDDPEVIAVAAVTKSGRATSYSEPGACILLGAPGGGGDTSQGLFTLDLVGPNRGVNSGITYQGDLNDYRWGTRGFIGTSAAAPLASGVAALVLSVNPGLGYRDVQQILLLSARQWDFEDPDLQTNGAGLVVSHNVGFGVPDAGQAVWLARLWTNRPPLVTVTMTNNTALPIPDDSLRVELDGEGIPSTLASIRCLPSLGPHADEPTPWLKLVDRGMATNISSANLTNEGALILRGSNTFSDKISNAAGAGAAFAIVYNTNGDDSVVAMGGTDYTPIPAVFIGNSDGEALKALFATNTSARARIRLQSADVTFHITGTLLCEYVGVRVLTDHPRRGDLRITLLSPEGTRSVLQTYNLDASPGPLDWTYWSTHHFLEGSAGDWKVSISDESAGATGAVRSVCLVVRGTQMVDSDHDGLDDDWEMKHFGALVYGPRDDPDGDGFSNAREQVMGTNPSAWDFPFQLDLSTWALAGYRLDRLSWPSDSHHTYDIYGGSNPGAMLLVTNVPGTFPVTEWLGPHTAQPGKQFYQVRTHFAP